ncbi:MAG: hypothetical protein COA73_16350 [Candidatus Hydrogenedentota bacterium]|nr:MAG: hypothetical protein COA73_16350 [Candidatus Hydrogenedentota bacterium]
MIKPINTYTLLSLLLVCSHVAAASNNPLFDPWEMPALANPGMPVEGQMRIENVEDIIEAICFYTYPDGVTGQVVCMIDVDDPALFSFVIPPPESPQVGLLTYYVEVLHGMHGTDRTASPKQTIPLVYEEDLDITANPPEILYFNLPPQDDAYTVRYKACCNILGASIIVRRSPVNPMETADGLPDTLYSDFVELEPDELSTSTAGLYFVFEFDPATFADTLEKAPILYEFVWTKMKWLPHFNYQVVDGNKIDIQAVEGGVFVLGAKK